MATLTELLLIANLLLAIGSIIASTISYIRGGFVHKFIRSVEKIDSTERRVAEIDRWRSDVEVVLVAVSENVDNVKENRIKDLFGDGVTVTELTVEEREARMEDGDDAM